MFCSARPTGPAAIQRPSGKRHGQLELVIQNVVQRVGDLVLVQVHADPGERDDEIFLGQRGHARPAAA
ncbi:hypothetical protein BH24ACT9_BH24ACT9_07600 [soil metagenome]